MSSNERDRNRGGESDDGFIEKLVAVNRVSKTVKGGRQFTFTALTVVGDGALMAALGQARSHTMRDIVASIQAEQDLVIRAPAASVTYVEGGPGTGKTAVGLHRVAYLLYAHRERLARTGTLVIGPNRSFLQYIEQVLPALGELEVRQATVDDLVAHVEVRGTDGAAAAVRVAEAMGAELGWDEARRVAEAAAFRQEARAEGIVVG